MDWGCTRFLSIALVVAGLTSVDNYVINGTKLGIIATLQMIFGNVSKYFWFVLFLLYFGGMGKALSSGVFGKNKKHGIKAAGRRASVDPLLWGGALVGLGASKLGCLDLVG